jgi:hypothetical protein
VQSHVAHPCAGALQASRRALDAVVDISPSVLDGDNSARQTGRPRHPARRVCGRTGVG